MIMPINMSISTTTKLMAERHRIPSFILSAAIFLILGGIIFWLQYYSILQSSPLVESEGELVTSKDDEIDRALLLEKLEARLATDPLNQPALNLYYVIKVRSRAPENELNNIRTLLSELGWRYTATQQNLLNQAVQERDFEAIVTRADGLLRREKFANEIISLLHIMETEPQTQKFLLKQLALNPPWRQSFFIQSDTLTSTGFDGRYRTLSMMLSQKQSLSHNELAPSLLAMVNSGEFVKAWRLFKYFEKVDESEIVFDPAFKKAAASRSIRYYRPLPFEWKTHSTRGLQVDAVETIGTAELRIRWNGRGTPLMLSQFVKIEPDQKYKLMVKGVGGKSDEARAIAFRFQCSDVAIDFEAKNQNGKETELALISTSPVPCEYPHLILKGRVQEFSGPIELSISSLQLTPSID